MILTEPVPFSEAVKILAQRQLLPTELTTAQLRAMDTALRNQSFFSAQTTLTDLLGEYKKVVQSIVNPEQVLRPGSDQSVTEGYNPATARTHIKEFLRSVGYEPDEGTRGTLLDLSSNKRVDLVIKTNVQLSEGAGHYVQQNLNPDVVDLWPALELVRFEDRKDPRDWPARWRIAAGSVGDVDAARILDQTGRMVALKASAIWQALGDGAGGFLDTLGNPFAPFAFGSGMGTEEVSRQESEELGLLEKGEAAEASPIALESLFGSDVLMGSNGIPRPSFEEDRCPVCNEPPGHGPS